VLTCGWFYIHIHSIIHRFLCETHLYSTCIETRKSHTSSHQIPRVVLADESHLHPSPLNSSVVCHQVVFIVVFFLFLSHVCVNTAFGDMSLVLSTGSSYPCSLLFRTRQSCCWLVAWSLWNSKCELCVTRPIVCVVADFEVMRDVCESCLQRQRRLLHPLNIYVVQVTDCAFDAAIQLCQWEKALDYGSRTLEPYR